MKEVVSDVKLDDQILQHTCEAKQIAVMFDVGPVFTNDDKMANLHRVNNGAQPVNEVSQIKISKFK